MISNNTFANKIILSFVDSIPLFFIFSILWNTWFKRQNQDSSKHHYSLYYLIFCLLILMMAHKSTTFLKNKTRISIIHFFLFLWLQQWKKLEMGRKKYPHQHLSCFRCCCCVKYHSHFPSPNLLLTPLPRFLYSYKSSL